MFKAWGVVCEGGTLRLANIKANYREASEWKAYLDRTSPTQKRKIVRLLIVRKGEIENENSVDDES